MPTIQQFVPLLDILWTPHGRGTIRGWVGTGGAPGFQFPRCERDQDQKRSKSFKDGNVKILNIVCMSMCQTKRMNQKSHGGSVRAKHFRSRSILRKMFDKSYLDSCSYIVYYIACLIICLQIRSYVPLRFVAKVSQVRNTVLILPLTKFCLPNSFFVVSLFVFPLGLSEVPAADSQDSHWRHHLPCATRKHGARKRMKKV